jgi:hypothetical protein
LLRHRAVAVFVRYVGTTQQHLRGIAAIERNRLPSEVLKAKNGAQVVNKELVLRSKLRIETRQFHMSRLHVQTWGEKQTIDIKSDWALLSEDERKRKADELIAMIRELREPPMQPPPLVYRPEEAPEEPKLGGLGSQPRR